jgi:hypothetical protein
VDGTRPKGGCPKLKKSAYTPDFSPLRLRDYVKHRIARPGFFKSEKK